MYAENMRGLIEQAKRLLDEARQHFEQYAYIRSEECARAALALLEPHEGRVDLGSEKDAASEIYAVLYQIAHAYNRLSVLPHAHGTYAESIHNAERSIEYCQRIDYKPRIAGLYRNLGITYTGIADFPRALECYDKALSLFTTLGDTQGEADVAGSMGLLYYDLSDYTRSLEYQQKALHLNQTIGDRIGLAGCLHNCGMLYLALDDNERALEYCKMAMVINEELNNKPWLAHNINCIANAFSNLGDDARALEYYHTALQLHHDVGDSEGVARTEGNIGSAYARLGDYNRAVEYFRKSLAHAQHREDRFSEAIALFNIGGLYAADDWMEADASAAEEHFLTALSILQELGQRKEVYQLHQSLSELYDKQQRISEAYEHFKEYHALEKDVQSTQAKKKAEQLDFKRKTDEREKQMEVERTRFQEREHILNNILPEEITTRLINGENPIADHFDSVSILFMDIVDFTALSSTISAQHLVHLLNHIFTAADGVMREFGLEKIKTIGDAYMAVAGAPVVRHDHAERAAQAALTLLDVMKNLVVTFPEEVGEKNARINVPKIDVRIGLHCGPAAAGVVGKHKFLYDLWGDAVNTAARMESYGEAGKIHVSEEFRNSAGGQFSFRERGEMEIKGKGKMRTFFMQRTDTV